MLPDAEGVASMCFPPQDRKTDFLGPLVSRERNHLACQFTVWASAV